MDSVGEGEGGKIWENGIETCKISCMKRVASQKKKKKRNQSSIQTFNKNELSHLQISN